MRSNEKGTISLLLAGGGEKISQNGTHNLQKTNRDKVGWERSHQTSFISAPGTVREGGGSGAARAQHTPSLYRVSRDSRISQGTNNLEKENICDLC